MIEAEDEEGEVKDAYLACLGQTTDWLVTALTEIGAIREEMGLEGKTFCFSHVEFLLHTKTYPGN